MRSSKQKVMFGSVAGGTIAFGLALLLALSVNLAGGTRAHAQAPAAPAAGPKLGTVKAIAGDAVTVLTDAGPTITITVPETAKVQQLAVGSTDLKTASPAKISDIAVGDRILSSVKPVEGSTDAFTARVVVVMKSGDIAQKNAAEQAEWRKNGTGGIVSSVDPSGTIVVTAGSKKVTVTTSSKTDFRRFTGDSVKFQDAKPGTLAQIQVNDQIQARGTKSEDGSSVQADVVVSGSFKNLSGVITSLDASSGKIVLKDLATKKVMTVTVTTNSDVRKMPLQMATMFAARSSAGAQGGQGSARGAGGGADAGPGPGGGGPGAGGAGGPGGARRNAGGDLSQMIARMPTDTLTDLKNGDAVMIVATEPTPGATTVTAVTVLSGVEPILTANPNGGMNLSGWSMGGGGQGE